MRVSVLACLAVCVLALLGVSPAAGEISDLQCHSGNSDDNGVCSGVRDTPTNNLAPYKPTFNKLDGTSFDTDQLRLLDVFISTDLGLQQDGLLDVHRITWVANNGVGNTGRNVSRTIGRDLPAGFLPFPFAFAYTADGLYLEPRTDTLPTPNQKVTGVSATFVYRLKNEQPAQIFPNGGLVYDGNTEVWLLFQPVGGFGFTAAIADSITATAVPNKDPIYEVTLRNNTLAPGTLPNGGFGTYFLTRRVVNAAAGTVTNDLSVSSGTTLQSVGGPQAVGNTYRVQKLSNAYDAPVLGNLAVPAPDGAFLTFTLALANSDVPAAGKVFISEAVLTLKSVTPVDGSSTGVALSGTYTLDTSASSAVVGSFVEGTQKLYVRPTGTATWSALPTSQYTAGNKQVTYTLSTSDANSFGSVASLDMAVQADVPVSSSSSSSSTGESSSSSAEPSSSSSAEPSSSSSSSSAPPSSSSSSSSAPPSSSSSSSASPSSSAAPSSSSSTGPVRSSSSSSTAPAPLSSSSSTGTPSSSTGISSSSTGASSSSSTAPSVDNGASTVGANGVAMALAAAAAVAALYA